MTKPFALSATEVTVAQFRQFVDATGYQSDAEKYGFGNSRDTQPGSTTKDKDKDRGKSWRDPGYAISDSQPVSQVSWNDAIAFCDWLSAQEQAVYRLPTGAEWEFACRAGTSSEFSFGDDDTQLSQYGWHTGNAQGRPQPVGKKLPNAFGLYDMHGNLEELCNDGFESTAYSKRTSPAINPIVSNSGGTRVLRGGSWMHTSFEPTSTFRYETGVSGRYQGFGFRVAREY